MDTKERILDAAERLFAFRGYAATSLRDITAEARVNLAAAHYHFGSKQLLLESVIMRRAEPVNRERLEMLDACEGRIRKGRLPVGGVLDAFFAPMFHVALTPGGETFVRLVGRLHAEEDMLAQIVKSRFGPVVGRFTQALRRALPDLPPEELFWRMQFALGAMAHALRGPQPAVEVMSGKKVKRPNPDLVLARLVTFVSAGMLATASRRRTK